MFQVPSSKTYIPDRICEIVIHSLSDDKEVFIKQLLHFLSEKGNFFDLEELERVGSQLLNLSTKQIQIEIEQRNKIRQLSMLPQTQKDDTQKLKMILHKLTVLNTLLLSVGQEMRTFKRRLPMMLGKYQNQIKSYFTKFEINFNDLKFQNKKLTSENSKLVELNERSNKSTDEEMNKLKNSLSKYQIKYNKLKSEKSQSDMLSENYQNRLKSIQNELEIVRTENATIQKERISMLSELSKFKEKSGFNDSIQFQQSSEVNSMKKQIQDYKEVINQDQQKIAQLEQIIQSHEEMTSKKFQNLIISQKIIKKLKDEFEKVSFVLNEIKSIDTNNDSNENILNKIKFIKSKIESKNFESEIIKELKEKCQELMLSKSKIKQNFNGEKNASNLKELSYLIEICTNLTVQDELHQILYKLNEKFEIPKIQSDNNETITKLFRQLNKKTKENQRLSIINQKLQSQKDDIQQQLGDIKMQLRKNPSLSPLLSTTSRIIFSPSRSTNDIKIDVNATPKASTKSEIINQTFDGSASPIFSPNQRQNYTLNLQRSPINNLTDNEQGDDEGEKELIDNEIFNEKQIINEVNKNNFSDIRNILNQNVSVSNSKSHSFEYNQNENFTLIQTLSALFDMNDADEIPNRISNLIEKSEEYEHFQTTLCSALNVNKEDSNNEIMIQIQKLKFENKKMKDREEKIKLLFNNQIPPSQIPNEIAKIVKNMKYIQKMLQKGNFDSCQELFESYYSIRKLNKAFVEREEMFRSCFSKYEFEKMPQFLSNLIKENRKFRSIEKEIEKVEPSITIFQAPKFILKMRVNFVKFMEKFCRIICSKSSILNGSDEANNEIINSIAKIDEMKLLLPQDDVIDLRGFVKKNL